MLLVRVQIKRLPEVPRPANQRSRPGSAILSIETGETSVTMTSASLDGKTRKSLTSTNNSTSASSASTKRHPRYEPMPHLSRADPEAGLRPASPPKTNPWTRMAKPRKTKVEYSPTESASSLPTNNDNGRSRGSSRSSAYNPAAIADSEISSNSDVKQSRRRSFSRDSSRSITSSVPNDSSICTNRTLRSLSTGSGDSRRALLAAALHAEEK